VGGLRGGGPQPQTPRAGFLGGRPAGQAGDIADNLGGRTWVTQSPGQGVHGVNGQGSDKRSGWADGTIEQMSALTRLTGLVAFTMVCCACASASSPAANTDAGLQVPMTVRLTCEPGSGACSLPVPSGLRNRPVRLPSVSTESQCPASPGASLALPNAAGVALGSGPVRVLIPQAGDLLHGVVYLEASDVSGWLGIKTLWVVSPNYKGWVVIRAERLDGPGPVAAQGEAGIGPVLIPPGTGPNDAGGWREQPSGTYVRTPGCYGFQADGTSFSERVIIRAVIPPP